MGSGVQEEFSDKHVQQNYIYIYKVRKHNNHKLKLILLIVLTLKKKKSNFFKQIFIFLVTTLKNCFKKMIK